MGSLIRHLNILLFFMLYGIAQPAFAANTTMPNVLGMTLKQAEQRLAQQGLSVGFTENQRTDRPTGTIIVQAPKPGRSIPKGQAVRVVIAIPLVKPKTTTVPNIKGMTLDEARKAIADANLKLGKIKKQVKKVEGESVVYQSPKPGKALVINSKVDLTLYTPANTGEPKVYIKLDKSKYGAGDTALITLSLRNVDSNRSGEYGFSINGRTHYTKSPSFKYTFPKSGRYVITASFRYTRGVWYPSLGKTVHVSSSRQSTETNSSDTNTPPVKEEPPSQPETTTPTIEKVSVPNVVGLPENTAIDLIKKAGLRVGKIETREDKSGKIRILKQTPRADKKVEKGSRIGLIKSIPEKQTEWQKPVAIIKPTTISVTAGETVRFYNRSTSDKKTKLKYEWTSNFGEESSNSRRFKIKTNDMSAGRYLVILKVTDSKKNTSYARAKLIIKTSKNTEEPASTDKDDQQESEPTNSNDQQESPQENNTSDKNADESTATDKEATTDSSNDNKDENVLLAEQNNITGNTPPASLDLTPKDESTQASKSEDTIKQIENKDHTFSVQIPADKDSRDIAPWNLQLMEELSGDNANKETPPESAAQQSTAIEEKPIDTPLVDDTALTNNASDTDLPATSQNADLNNASNSQNTAISAQEQANNEVILQESLQTESIANTATDNTVTEQNSTTEQSLTATPAQSNEPSTPELRSRESSSGWLIWTWGLLSGLILTVLLFFLWKFRQSHQPGGIIIDYQHQSDMGFQEFILDDEDGTSTDSLRFSSQRDNGLQDFSLESKKH